MTEIAPITLGTALFGAALARSSGRATLALADAVRVIEIGQAEAVRLHVGPLIAVTN